MSYNESLVDISVPSHADYTADQYTFMKINSAGRAEQAGVADKADGVLQNKPNLQDRPANIAISGVTKMVAGAAVALGANVSPDANGEAITSVTGATVAGRALEAAGAQGDIIAVLLNVQNNAIVL